MNLIRWIKATPSTDYSAIHEVSFLGFHFSVYIDFTLHKDENPPPEAWWIFIERDSNALQSHANYDFCIGGLKRWRLDLTLYNDFEEFVQGLDHSHRHTFHKAQESFSNYGATLSLIDDDWSCLADQAYALYEKTATRHGHQLYDREFFRVIAKKPIYKLLCAWYQEKMIGMTVLIEEDKVLHSVCCGLDYEHSSPSFTYSALFYDLIRSAIASKKYTTLDVGLTGDQAKSMIGFKPILAQMEVTVRNPLLRGVLRLASKFLTATLSSEGNLQLRFSRNQLAI